MKRRPTTTAPAVAPEDLPTTGAVARRLGVSEARVQTVLRTTPTIRPPLVSGKRRWRPEDVAALEARLASLARR